MVLALSSLNVHNLGVLRIEKLAWTCDNGNDRSSQIDQRREEENGEYEEIYAGGTCEV